MTRAGDERDCCSGRAAEPGPQPSAAADGRGPPAGSPRRGYWAGHVAGERRIDFRRVYDAFNKGDLDALIDSFSVDAEQIVSVLGQTHRGRVEIRRSFEEYFEVVDAHNTEPIEFIEEGDRVVVPVRLHGRLRHTGITDEMIPTEMVHAFAVRDGQIVWNYICVDKDEAIQAARSRE